MLTRLALLFFYYRLTTHATWTRSFRWLLHLTVAFVTIVGLVTVFLSIFVCRWVFPVLHHLASARSKMDSSPVRAYWTIPGMPHSTCRSTEGIEAFVASVLYCVCDVVVLALPIPVVWQLQLSVRKRLEITALLGVGLIATAAGCLRTYYIWRLSFKTWDASWTAYSIYLSCCLEVNLGIVSIC